MSKRKISCICASYLGQYGSHKPGPIRDAKFKRAVKSFINQTYDNKELIIIADGCQRTQDIYDKNFADYDNIKCIMTPKQQLYSGEIRNIGNKIATGDIITYLDNDDVIGKNHFEIIERQFTDVDWVYYDDYLVLDKSFKQLQTRRVQPRFGSIGTSSITHKNIDQSVWYTGYGHDWLCVLKLASLGLKFKKLKETPQYLVAHWGTGAAGTMNRSGGDF